MGWLCVCLGLVSAWGAERSPGLSALSGAGLVLGGGGAVVSGAGLGFLSGLEPIGFMVFYPPGSLMLVSGAGMSLGGALAQADRVGAKPTAGLVGLGLAGTGVVVATVGLASGYEAGIVGGTGLMTAALAAGAVQGAVNRAGSRGGEEASLGISLLPERHGASLQISGRW